MCYAGGPYCYTHSKDRYEKAHEALKEKPTEANIKRFKEAVLQLDTTPKGMKHLELKLKSESSQEDVEHYRKRLELAKKTVQAQNKNKNQQLSAKKFNDVMDKIENESEISPTGHILLNQKQANRLAKVELENKYPGTKFSVRGDQHQIMHVTFDDENVEASQVLMDVQKYKGFAFNGMTDNYDPQNGFSIRGRSMSTLVHGVSVKNKADTFQVDVNGPRLKRENDDINDNPYPHFNAETYEAFQKTNAYGKIPYSELVNSEKRNKEDYEERKNIVNKWGKDHDKDGKYIYRNPQYVSDVVAHNDILYYREGSKAVNGGEYKAYIPSSFRIQVDKELTPEEAENLSNTIKYAYTTTGGENSFYENTIQDSPNSVIVHLDTTKNNAYQRLDRFFNGIKEFTKEGTPTRKDGSKAIQKTLGENNKIEIYSDEAFFQRTNL